MYPFYVPPELYEALGLPSTTPPRAGRPPQPQVMSPPPPAPQLPPQSGWRARLPDLAMAAAAVAQRLAQPRRLGETGMMAATQALVQGYNALAQADWMRHAQQMAQRQRQLEEAKTLADIERTRSETKKTLEEAGVVKPKVEIDRMRAEAYDRRVQALEKQVDGQLRLKGKELELEARKFAAQAAARQQELKLKERQVAAMEENTRSLAASRAAQTDIDLARLKLDQAKVELDRKRTEAYLLTAQAKVLEAAAGNVPPEKLRADLYKLGYQYLPPGASDEEREQMIRHADRFLDAYEKRQQAPAQQAPAQQEQPRAWRIQPTSPDYVDAVQTSDGKVYQRRRDGQWFRTK